MKDIRGQAIHGCRITRKSTGASLFIPAAGTWEGTTSGINSVQEGYVWSSGLGTIAPTYALSFKFDSKNTGTSLSMYYIYRYYGLPIRPVCE